MAPKNSLDLLLINPSNRVQIYQSLSKNLAAVEPPVWAGLIASFARKRGCSVAILDAEAEGLIPDQVAKRVEELNPLLTAVVVYGHQPSASTQNMSGCHNVCTAIKSALPESKLLLVGGHVAALPERT
ncbi:MAG TPA: cobalamin B12-binding domain-containing protein, partial [Terriglobia bacterium]|nr:cobalamin B12-binding domain-containing protein [Terriglobia bacterium]